jgi:TatD DNase family protein
MNQKKEHLLQYKYFDTHAHLNIEPLFTNEVAIVQECESNKILINNIGTDLESSLLAIKQAKKYDNVFCSIGVHPTALENVNFEEVMTIFEELLSKKEENKIIAIGETGYDFFHNSSDLETQKKFFLGQIKLAIKYNLPLILHIREAHDEAYELITKEIPTNIKVVIHCFDSTIEMGEKYIKSGYFIGIGGLVTRENKIFIREVVKKCDISRILSETDCPFLSPKSHSKEKNKPLFMIDSIKEIENLRNEKCEEKIFNNAINFFFNE